MVSKDIGLTLKIRNQQRKIVLLKLVSDIATLKSEIEDNRNVTLDAKGDILEALRSVENF